MGGLRYAPSITNCKGVLKWNILYLTRINIAVFYKLFWCEKVGNFSFTNNGEWETLTSRPPGEQSKFYTEAPTVFTHPQFGTVRTVEISGEPWFVGKDVATALGYANPSNAVSVHVDKEDKTSYLIQVSGSNYKANTALINESGLYALILSSKLRSAKDFKHWVTTNHQKEIS